MQRIAAACLLLALTTGAAPAQDLSTQAERSGFRVTGRYAEVERLCQAFVDRWPDQVRCETFGTTPEGRPMLALVASQRGALQPDPSQPVVLMQGGIHAGEIDGKEAGFLALRELLEKPGPLEKFTLVFVPVFNIDGHERFGPWNRPNQTGPEEMGWRVTSHNLNLNRDYTKAEAPEMAAMLGLLRRWDPILYVDLHVTDGAQFQPDVANLVEPVFCGSPRLQGLGRALMGEVKQRLTEQGVMALDFYPAFRDYRNPLSGFEYSAHTPRFSTGYWPLHNRFAMLVETHSWKPYPSRVQTTRKLILAVCDLAARDGLAWLAAARQADRESLAGTRVALAYANTGKRKIDLDFPGYAYTTEHSEVSGTEWLRYQPGLPKVWKVPLYTEVAPRVEVTAPAQGYLVPSAQAALVRAKLDLHGIRYQVLEKAEERPLEVFRAERVEFSSRPFEGRTTASVQGKWSQETQAVGPGSLFVPIAQPRARLAMALLEPQSPDSLLAWGFFNAHFEVKEYMEDYVTEQVAREMLRQRPEVAAEFSRRLREDPEFARSPAQRLEFFHRLHPSFDRRLNLYPIMRY